MSQQSPTVGFAKAHSALLVFLVAFAVRATVAFILTVLFDGSLVPDDSTYSTMASQAAAGERGGWDAYTHELYRGTFAFLGPVAFIYSIVGPEPLAAQVFVALLGALTAAATTAVGVRFLTPPWGIAAGLAVAVLPSQALWSSLILKDAAVWFALSSLAAVVVIGVSSTGWRLLPLAAACAGLLIALAYLREHTLVVACFALALASIAGAKKHRLWRVSGAVSLAVGIPWLVGIGPAGVTLVTDSGSLEERRIQNAEGARTAFVEAEPEEQDPAPASEDPNLQQRIAALQAEAEQVRIKARSGRGSEAQEQQLRERADSLEQRAAELQQSASDRDEELSDPAPEAEGSLDPHLAHLPRGLAVMLFEPVPWRTGGSTALQLARLEALAWYPLLLLAAVGLWSSRKHLQALSFPLLVGGGMLFVYALTEGNIGTAFRHRGEFVWVVALLAALGLDQLTAGRRRVHAAKINEAT